MPSICTFWADCLQRVGRASRSLRALRGARPAMKFGGQVMGTCYAVTIVGRPAETEPERFHAAARGELKRVEGGMSACLEDSDVGRINAAGGGEWIVVSPETTQLLETAMQIGRLSGGAYDVTAGSLVDLWGFGPGGGKEDVPAAGQIEAARKHVGLDRLDIRSDPPGVRKRDAGVRIDLASVAKGFGVDRAAEALERLGIADFCVDVGGEVRVGGLNARGTPWQVTIESPIAEERTFQRMVGLKDQALATSGDYRIFLEAAGARYPHLIDPRTGRPVGSKLASVSVVDASCATADAWATALMVAGAEDGFELAASQGLAARFLVRTPDGVEERGTEGWRLQQPSSSMRGAAGWSGPRSCRLRDSRWPRGRDVTVPGFVGHGRHLAKNKLQIRVLREIRRGADRRLSHHAVRGQTSAARSLTTLPRRRR